MAVLLEYTPPCRRTAELIHGNMNDNDETVIETYERSIHRTRSYGKSSSENNDNEDDEHETKNQIIHNFDIDDNANKHVDTPKISTKNTTTTSSSSSSMSLTWIQASWLITAECLGTGILALPSSVRALSPNSFFGWIFLILQIPIHIMAGILLCHTADRMDHDCHHEDTKTNVENNHHHNVFVDEEEEKDERENIIHDKLTYSITSPTCETNRKSLATSPNIPTTNLGNDSSVTRDYVGLSMAIFGIWKTSPTTTIVMIVYYANLFLVLGNYNLVMSHAMVAFLGGGCLPLVGILSSILGILILLPLRSMANFGRSVSLLSLMALLMVVIQCLVALSHAANPPDRSLSITEDKGGIQSLGTTWFLTSRQLSAMASVAYAVGSQKLLLNVRNVMTVRQDASKSLIVAVSSYVMFYLMVCILAGSNPPPLLLDAIPKGWSRRLAGLLLWLHLMVSYSINSQALCSSIEQVFLRERSLFPNLPAFQWFLLTSGISLSSYLVANAIPFFSDLVSFIGALTSIPLSLMFPAIFYHQSHRIDMSLVSFVCNILLFTYALLFTIAGLIGSIESLNLDWSQHRAFSCT